MQYELILPFLQTQLGRSKATETVFNHINDPSFEKFHTETVKGEV